MGSEIIHLNRQVVERVSLSKRHTILFLYEDGNEYCDPIVVASSDASCFLIRQVRTSFFEGKDMPGIMTDVYDVAVAHGV